MPREITPRNDRMYYARLNAGLTQDQLAEAVGVSRQMINGYERLRAVPSEEVAERIAEVLNLRVRARDLFNEGPA